MLYRGSLVALYRAEDHFAVGIGTRTSRLDKPLYTLESDLLQIII
jgi:hypothetical protein